MNFTNDAATRGATAYFGLFQSLFEAADMTSSFWQPLLKGIGRSHLEMASFSARQGQALVRWQQTVAANPSPMNVIAANIAYWQSMTDDCVALAPRIAAAAVQASHAVPAFEVVPLPARKRRDRLEIPNAPVDSEIDVQRRVA